MQSFFWNELEIETLEDRDRQSGPSPRTTAMIDFFLDNTRGASFSFTFFKQSKHIEISYAHRILPKLLGHSMQWKNVSVQLLLSELPLLCNAKNRLSSLKSLELILGTVDSIPGYQLTPQLGNIFEDAPLLKDIKLCYPPGLVWTFNWALLTSLYIHSRLSRPDIISVLRQTTLLEELTIGDRVTDSSSWSGFGIVKLPCLKYLEVHGVPVLANLEVPALKVLKVDFLRIYSEIGPAQWSDREKADWAIHFIQRSNCKLSRFFPTNLSALGLTDILPYTPDLEELSLLNVRSLQRVMRRLSRSQSGSTGGNLLLPQLDVLSLYDFGAMVYYQYRGVQDLAGDLEAVQNMVAHRNPPGNARSPSPKMLRLRAINAGEEQDAVDRLKMLCKDRGIRLEFVQEL